MAGDRLLRSAAASVEEPIRGALVKTAALVGNGMLLSKAGRHTGIFAPRDRQLVEVGEGSGNVDHVLGRLAEYYRLRASRLRRVRAKLAYPLFILMLAVFVAPFPALFAGSITTGGYLSRTFVPLVGLAVFGWLVTRWFARVGSQGYPGWLASGLLALPIVKGLVTQHARTDLLESLALFLSAGLAAQQALPAAIDVVSNPLLKLRFRRAQSALESGEVVADALREGEVIDAREGYAILSTAEHAGRLDEMMTRYAAVESDNLDARYDVIAEWLPRIVYFLVVGLVVAQLL